MSEPPGDEPDPPESDAGPPSPSAADDVWARLRLIEDLAPPVPSPDTPGDGPVPTAVAPRAEGPVAPPPVEPANRRWFVPAPDAAPPSAAAAAERYREVRDAPAATPRRPAPAPAAPTPAPPAARDRGRGRRRRNPLRPKLKWFRPKLRWFFLYLPLLVVLALLGTGWWAWNTFDAIERVDLGDSLATPDGDAVNYLVVGSDSREGIDAETPNVGVIGTGTEVAGRRSDTIIVLRVADGSARMMSIPRDLWVRNVATGREGRINGAYAEGPANLVDTVRANLGIPVHHYVEVSFVSFAGMVDAMGGIDIEFAHPAMDVNSGLAIPTAGVHRLDGSQALAYVRSRHYVEEIDGVPVAEKTGDIGRQVRQQTFIRTVLSTVGDTRNPLTLARVAGAATDGVKVDTELGFFDSLSLARRLGGVTPESVVLPTQNATKGKAAVLLLRNAEALPVLASFGATGG